MPQFRIQTFCFTLMTICAVSALTTSTVRAEERRVGVAVSAVINVSPDIGARISQTLGDALEEKFALNVISGAESQQLLPAAARSESCLGDTNCLVSAGHALDVDELLMLIIVDNGETYKIEATWIDVGSSKTTLRPAIDIPKLAEKMTRSLTQQARTLLPNAEVRQAVKVVPSLPPVPPKNTDVGEKNTKSVTAPKPIALGHQWTSTSKGLLIGGLAGGIIWAGYGSIHFAECDFSVKCGEGNSHPTLDTASDIIGGLSILSLSVATYLYLTSETIETVPTVSLQVENSAAAISYRGMF